MVNFVTRSGRICTKSGPYACYKNCFKDLKIPGKSLFRMTRNQKEPKILFKTVAPSSSATPPTWRLAVSEKPLDFWPNTKWYKSNYIKRSSENEGCKTFSSLAFQIDCIVATAGGIEEDFIKCLAPTYLGDFALDGKTLRDKGKKDC